MKPLWSPQLSTDGEQAAPCTLVTCKSHTLSGIYVWKLTLILFCRHALLRSAQTLKHCLDLLKISLKYRFWSDRLRSAWDPAFLTSSQGMLMLQDQESHFEKQGTRLPKSGIQILVPTVCLICSCIPSFIQQLFFSTSISLSIHYC